MPVPGRPFSACVSQRVTNGDLFVNQRAKPFAQLTTRAVQTAPDRADGNVQDRANFLVTEPIEFLHHHDGPVIVGQRVQCVLNDLITLGLFGGKPGITFPRVDRPVSHGTVLEISQLRGGTPSSPAAQRQVHRDR